MNNTTPLVQSAKYLNDDSFIVYFSVTNLAAFYNVTLETMSEALKVLKDPALAQEVFVTLSDIPQLNGFHNKPFLPEMLSSPFRFSHSDVKIDLSGNNVSIKVSAKHRKSGFADDYVRGINQGQFYFLPRLCKEEDSSDLRYLSPFMNMSAASHDEYLYLRLIAFDLCYVDISSQTEIETAEPVKGQISCLTEDRDESLYLQAIASVQSLDLNDIDDFNLAVEYLPAVKQMLNSSACVDTLTDIVELGPVEDGDVVSKNARDVLLQLGLISKVIVKGNDGYQAATYTGNQVLKMVNEFPKTGLGSVKA